MFKLVGEGSKYRQIGRSLEIKDETAKLGLIVLFEPDFPQGLEYLAPSVVDAMRSSNKCNNHVLVGSLIEQDLGMACRNYLRSRTPRSLRYQGVDFSLSQNFEMRIGFIQE